MANPDFAVPVRVMTLSYKPPPVAYRARFRRVMSLPQAFYRLAQEGETFSWAFADLDVCFPFVRITE